MSLTRKFMFVVDKSRIDPLCNFQLNCRSVLIDLGPACVSTIQRRCDMRHELLTWHALFCIRVNAKKRHAESAFRDACHTSCQQSSDPFIVHFQRNQLMTVPISPRCTHGLSVVCGAWLSGTSDRCTLVPARGGARGCWPRPLEVRSALGGEQVQRKTSGI